MTVALDKNEALAICFRNLKGTKTKDLLGTARALKYLRNLPEFSSNKQLGQQVGVSGEIIRQFIALLDLPPLVQKHLANGRLGLEQGRRLWQLSQTRPSLVEDVSEAIASMTAMETRDLIEYLLRTPAASIQDGLRALDEAKPTVVHEYHIDAIIGEREYRALKAQARKRRVHVNDLVSTIVACWVEDYDV